MDETYARILKKIHRQSPSDRKRAKKILQWVAFARQPLTLEQLATAIAIEPDAHRSLKAVHITPFPWKPILDITCNLLTADDANFVNFTHYSAKEYLTRLDSEQPDNMSAEDWTVVQRYLLHPDHAHQLMFDVCLAYLGFSEFEQYLDFEECGGSTNGIDSWVKASPFVSYAARWWNYHMEELSRASEEVPGVVIKRLGDLIVPGSKRLHVLMNTYLNMRAKVSNMGWTLHPGAMYVELAFISII